VPELPEVETVVREVRPHLLGRTFVSLQVSNKALRRRWRAEWTPLILNTRIQEVSRRGKWIIINLESGSRLVIHLGMSGQLTVTNAREVIAAHTHLIWDLNRKDRQLRFRDIRRFGSAMVFSDPGTLEQYFVKGGLGPEPFVVTPKYWRRCLGKTSRCLKAILLDQRVVAGVGNIYADESLFTARLYPGRIGRDLSPTEVQRLRTAIVKVLERAIEKRGSSIRNYVGGSGLRGGYQEEFCVYQQTGKPCPRCKTPIRSMRLAGRATHFCPRCQPESNSKPVRRSGR
jgi:formamidopyrimidine-DNA glycosylase